MKTLPILAAALVLPAIAIAQERTAGQAIDAQVNWTALKNSIDLVSNQNKAIAASLTAISGKIDAIAACGAQQMVWNGTGCAASGSSVQAGTVYNTSAFATRSVYVAFPRAFSRPPQVYLALNRYRYHDNCRQDQFLTGVGAGNITKTGFVMTFGGSITCGGEERVEGITWVAIE